MPTVEKSIVVDVPVRTAYNQWTQFEEFPEFMDGVEEVRQLDDKRLHWKASLYGNQEEWTAEIVRQVPDQEISWRSTSGDENSGTVRFQPVDANRTRVTLQVGYEPKGVIEKTGDLLGMVGRSVEEDLENFKEFIEERGHETGGWRGEIPDQGRGTTGGDSAMPDERGTMSGGHGGGSAPGQGGSMSGDYGTGGRGSNPGTGGRGTGSRGTADSDVDKSWKP